MNREKKFQQDKQKIEAEKEREAKENANKDYAKRDGGKV